MPKSTGAHKYNQLVPANIMKLKAGFHGDGNCLYLKVDPNGSRRWIMRTMVQGKRRDIGLGSPPVVSLKTAREEVLKLRAIVASGGDPLAARQRAKTLPTFEQAARDWYAGVSQTYSNRTHTHQVIRTLETYAFPTIGSKKIDQIGPSDFVAVLQPIWLIKHETATRLRQRMGSVIDWAITKGLHSGPNPQTSVLKGLPRHGVRVKPHAALHYSKVPAFINALKAGKSSDIVKLGFEFLILTACRSNEVMEARWGEIDIAEAKWTIPATRMKAKREHAVPLVDQTLALLKRAKGLSGSSDFIFSIDGARPLSSNTFLKARETLGYECTPHGFRSSFRDWAAEQTSYPRDVCERALAHTVRDKAEAAYLRTDQFTKRRGLMAEWAEYCAGVKNNK